MGVLSKICSVLAWICFVIGMFFQGLLILTFWMPPFFAAQFPGGGARNEVNLRALPFLVTGAVLFAAGFILLSFVKKRRWIWIVLTLAGALLLAGVGLYLQVNYQESIVADGVYAGYTPVKLVTRHMLPLAAALFAGIAALLKKRREDKHLLADAMKETEDFTPRFE